MLWNEDGKRWNVCAAKVAKATSQNPILRQINLPWSWWGIECLDRKCGTFTIVFVSYRGAWVPPLAGHQERGGLYRISSPPYRPRYRGGPTPPKPRVQVPMGERLLELSQHNHMRWYYSLPTRKAWRPLRPSAMILIDSMMNVEKGHKPTARVRVDPGAFREAIPRVKPKPAAKALPALIPEMCIPHHQMDNLIGE